ncbi:MAG: YggS family pyridoxal phosphate-dependent enzyme [Deltaproteobacteria bacterium]|jgi:pyridoxal phosphate enzyme (YggS family)
MADTIEGNLIAVLDRVKAAARKAGREPTEITLVAITKNVELKKVKEAISGGARVFGENYVQEAEDKIKKIKDASVKWHFTGHLQKNKAKFVVELFDVIETIDSVELAAEVNKRAKKPIECLIEINIAREKTKTGVGPDHALKLAKAISGMENLRLIGLMCIPPASEDVEGTRPYFVALRRLAERINKEQIPGVAMRELSMGMSGDFEAAVEEGATFIRVGTAIFGHRAPQAAKRPKKGQ